jgi:hypothetical protein
LSIFKRNFQKSTQPCTSKYKKSTSSKSRILEKTFSKKVRPTTTAHVIAQYRIGATCCCTVAKETSVASQTIAQSQNIGESDARDLNAKVNFNLTTGSYVDNLTCVLFK